MGVGLVLLAAAVAQIAPAACRLSAAQKEVYARATAATARFADRRAAYEETIRACPGDARLYREFAALSIANRDFDTALLWSGQGLKSVPSDPALSLRKGEALVALGREREALGALAQAPANGESEFFQGLAYQALEDHGRAQASFLAAWRLGDEDPYVLYALMKEDKALGDRTGGLAHFQLMSARFPDSVWMHVLVGDAHFEQAQETEAKREYLEAVKIAPDLFEPNFRLAYLDFQAGEYGAAVDYYRRALAAKPHHTEANVYLGEALRRAGKTGEAIAQLRRAIGIDPKSSLAYDSLAKALMDSGRLREAADTLASAEREFPEESSFPAMRARVLARMGRSAEAQEEARRAAQLMADRNKKQALVAK